MENLILLDLFPGQHSEDIICETRTACLGKSVPYEAVSYVWMEAGGRRSIQVSGEITSVTNNLYDALQRLRYPTQTRTLWVDQLCIDQWDNEKKAKQVDMMRLIYRQCDRCLIWFGELSPTADFSTEDVENIFEFIRVIGDPALNPKMQQPLLEKLSSPETSHRARTAFVALGIHGNPWWSRIWTVQESILPRAAQLVWGSQVIEWSEVQQASRNWCSGLWVLAPESVMIFKDLMDEVASPVRGLELAQLGESPLNILERWRYRGATDPRDKIFALLGLFPESPFSSVQHCDYTLSVKAVYTGVTVDLLEIEGGLRSFVGIRGSINHGLPTWVTDFASVPSVNTSERWWNHIHRYIRCNADAYTTFNHAYLPEVQALQPTGIRIDGVDDVAEDFLSANEHTGIREDDLLRVIRSWHDKTNWNAAKFGQEYPNGNTRKNAFGATLIGDFLVDEFPTRGALPDEHRMVVHHVTTGDKISSYTLSHSLRTFVMNQRFFVTTDGLMGMGPQMMKSGDEVWILFGGRVPFILRPRHSAGEPDNGYILVGHAFVYGIMDGEAVSSRRAEQRSVRLY